MYHIPASVSTTFATKAADANHKGAIQFVNQDDAVGEFAAWKLDGPAVDEKKEEEGGNNLATGLLATAMALLLMN